MPPAFHRKYAHNPAPAIARIRHFPPLRAVKRPRSALPPCFRRPKSDHSRLSVCGLKPGDVGAAGHPCSAKRLECDQLAGAIVKRGHSKSGSKLRALQTLRAQERPHRTAVRHRIFDPEYIGANSRARRLFTHCQIPPSLTDCAPRLGRRRALVAERDCSRRAPGDADTFSPTPRSML